MKTFCIKIVFITILTCILASCSRYNYTPQTAQSNKQVEIFYQEQDLSSSKGSSGIEPYKNETNNSVNTVNEIDRKEGVNQFQKSIRSTRQAYLVKAIVKKMDKNQERTTSTLDTLANTKEASNIKMKDPSKGFAIASIIAGTLGIIAIPIIPFIAALFGFIASIISLVDLIYMLFNWFQNHKRHSTVIWLLCILGLIIGIAAIYIGGNAAMKPL
jgi:hypothetical protein